MRRKSLLLGCLFAVLLSPLIGCTHTTKEVIVEHPHHEYHHW